MRYYILQFDGRDDEVNLYSFSAENEEEAINEKENSDGNYLNSMLLSEKQYKNLLKSIQELEDKENEAEINHINDMESADMDEGLKEIQEHEDCTDDNDVQVDEEMEARADLRRKEIPDSEEAERQENFCN